MNKNNEMILMQKTTRTGGQQKFLYKQEEVLKFSSKRKRMSVIIKDGDQYVLYMKGADSIVLPRCNQRYPSAFIFQPSRGPDAKHPGCVFARRAEDAHPLQEADPRGRVPGLGTAI